MDLGLKDTAVLVTASSQGIGRAIATEFAREGARVAMCSRRKDAIERAADEIARDAAHRPHAIVADIATAEGCERFIAEALGALGHIDTLVVNSGKPKRSTFEQLDDEGWQRVMELVFLPSVRLVRRALPELRKTKGNVVLMTAASVRHPGDYPGWVPSVAVRSAVHGLLKALAKELEGSGVRVNAVMPGYIPADGVGRGTDGTLLGRNGRPEEVAAVAVFLASRRASYVNSASFVVDGGETSATF